MMRTYPPAGMALTPYSVSPRRVDHSRGPKPRKNSVTFMPDHLAVMKCPNSCSMIIRIRAATTATVFTTSVITAARSATLPPPTLSWSNVVTKRMPAAAPAIVTAAHAPSEAGTAAPFGLADEATILNVASPPGPATVLTVCPPHPTTRAGMPSTIRAFRRLWSIISHREPTANAKRVGCAG